MPLLLQDPVPVFDIDERAKFDQQLGVRVDRLNAIVRLRRDVVQLVRVHARDIPDSSVPELPTSVSARVVYTLTNFAAGLFALKPWEGPTSERERFDALLKAIEAEERVHAGEVLRVGSEILPSLVSGPNSIN